MAQRVAGVVVGVVGLVGDPAFAAGAADGLGVGPRQAEQRPQIARAAGPDARRAVEAGASGQPEQLSFDGKVIIKSFLNKADIL